MVSFTVFNSLCFLLVTNRGVGLKGQQPKAADTTATVSSYANFWLAVVDFERFLGIINEM